MTWTRSPLPHAPGEGRERGEGPGVSCLEDERSEHYVLKEVMKYKGQAGRCAFEMRYGQHCEKPKNLSFCKIAPL